jgi:beta-RFAP synthase
LEARPSEKLVVLGEKKDLVEPLAKRFLQHFQIESGARIHVKETIPEHVGLGSMTQLSLAVTSALAKIFGLDVSIRELARIMGRGKFSGVGTAAFERGGFIVEGGHKLGGDEPSGTPEIPPVIVRLSFPENWLFVVTVPSAKRGLDEKAEKLAFERLQRAPPERADRICRLVLMKMLPSLVETDFTNFGRTLSEVQQLVGNCFKTIQGATFSSPVARECVKFMLRNGAAGVGQSSWGPAIYGLVEGENEAELLKKKVEDFLLERGRGDVFYARANNTGAHMDVIK